jgi:hypothetical protein
MAKKRNAVLAKEEVVEVITDAIDELLKAELAKIEDMKEPGKSSTAENLKRYYDAQRSQRNESAKV